MRLKEIKREISEKKDDKQDEEISHISGIDNTAEHFSTYVLAAKYIKETNPSLYAKIMNWD